jgi:hypothetical protein
VGALLCASGNEKERSGITGDGEDMSLDCHGWVSTPLDRDSTSTKHIFFVVRATHAHFANK